jgi:hypothetical protein
MKPDLIIRQNTNSTEVRVIGMAAILRDIACASVDITNLNKHKTQLVAGMALPVGSVEFVREAMRIAGFPEPANMSYPDSLRDLLYREVLIRKAGEVIGSWFVKPLTTKAFTGFVFDTMQNPDSLDEHDREQHAAFMAMGADAQVWVSEPVRWLSEHRFYVANGEVIGSARYDPDGEDDAPSPRQDVIQNAVARLRDATRKDLTCALDFGVLSTGETALVEVNDAFALGLYGRSIEPRIYLDMLARRWAQIAGA